MAANSVFIDISLKDKFSPAASKVNRSLTKVRRGFKGLSRDADLSAQSLGRSKSSLLALGRLKGLAGGLLGTAAVTAGFKASLKNFATLELATLNVLSLVTDADEKVKFKPIFEGLIKDAGKFGFTVDEAGKALFDQVSQAGFNAQSLKNYKGGLELAIGGNANFADSITVVNKLLENFPELANNAEKAGSILFTGQVFGSTNVGELARVLPEAAGIVAAAGISADQFVSLVSLSTKKLGGTASAGIAFRAFVDTFDKVTRGSDQFKALKRLRLPTNVVEFQKIGIDEVLAIIAEVRQGTDRQRLDLSQAFTEVRAKKFLNVVNDEFLRQNTKVIAAMERNFRLSLGLKPSFEAIANSLSTSISSLGQAITQISSIVGEVFAPAVNSLTDTLLGFLERVEARGGKFGGLATETALGAGDKFASGFFGSPVTSFINDAFGNAGPDALRDTSLFGFKPFAPPGGDAGVARVDIVVGTTGNATVESTAVTSEGLDVGVQRGN